MKQVTIVLAGLLLLSTQIACCGLSLPQVPVIEIPEVELPKIEDIEIPDVEIPDIELPTIEAGEMQEKQEMIPLPGTESMDVNVRVVFGAGELTLGAGNSDQLFSGSFRYNVERWEPEVSYDDGSLTIEQGGTEEDWGIPTGNVENEWDIAFSPLVPLGMDFKIGAGDGNLDFTGLQLAALDADLGAGNFKMHFGEPNESQMSHLTLNTGASKLEMTGIGNAGPERVNVQGGVGEIKLDFTGAWPNSADVEITSGVGSVTLRLPDDVGVQVETEGGLADVNVSGLQRASDAYVNDAFGDAETELRIHVTTGIGSLRLIEVPNE